MKQPSWSWAIACALSLLIPVAAAAQTRAEASTTLTPAAQRALQAPHVAEAPSPFWLVAGITLVAGGLALNLDAARRFDDGHPSCFSGLEPGACMIEGLIAGPVGLLGGGSLLLYGLWLGKHDASLALATGQSLQDYGALKTWSLIGLIGGAAVAVGVNMFVVGRLMGSPDAYDECPEADRADRAEACGGGKILGLAIVQSIGLGIAAISAGALGYALGYQSERGKAWRRMLGYVRPWASASAFGLALTLQG